MGPMWDLLTWDHAASFFGSCISMPPTHATFNFFSPCFLLFLHFLCFVFGNTSFSARRHLAQSHISSHSTRDKALCELSPSQAPRSPPFASIYGRPQALFVSLEATYRVGLGRSLDPVRDAFFVFGEAATYRTTPLPISCPRPTLAPFLAKHIPMLSQKDISTSLSTLSHQNTYKSFCPIECLHKQS